MRIGRTRIIFTAIVLFAVASLSLFGLSACEKNKEEVPHGEFCSLQSAYDQGLLTLDDLRSIAFYQNKGHYYDGVGYDEGFAPKPIRPEALSADVELAIKEKRAYLLRIAAYPDAKAEDVYIRKYLGSYGGSVVVVVDDAYTQYPFEPSTYMCEGITFHLGDCDSITVFAI